MEDKNLPLTIFQNLMELTMNVNQSFEDNIQILSDIVYNHIKNAEYDTISLPNSFGDSYIKWWGRHLTSQHEIIETLEEEFYEFKEQNLQGFDLVERWSTGDTNEKEDTYLFQTPLGDFDLGQVYHGEFDDAILSQILDGLVEEEKIILLPNDEWTDTESYFDMSPDW